MVARRNGLRCLGTMDVPLLTFDDGPSESTAEILDLLADYTVQATFFVIGSRAVQRPDLVERAAAEGHFIGNHTWDHVALAQLTNDDHVTEKLRHTNDAIEEILGAAPTLFRGPWLDVDDRVKRLAKDLELTHLDVHVDTNDYDDRFDADYVANAILDAHAGQIVLLHDGNGDERGAPINPPRPKTVEALRRALPDFTDRWRSILQIRDASTDLG